MPGQDQYFSMKDIIHDGNIREAEAMNKITKLITSQHGKLDVRRKKLKFPQINKTVLEEEF